MSLMPNVNFYLKSEKPDRLGRVPVYVQITYARRKYRKNLFKVKRSDWNPKKQQLRPPANYKQENDYLKLNEYLNKYKTKATSFFNDFLSNEKEITPEVIKNFLSGKKKNNKIYGFFETFDLFIETKKADKANNTIRGYQTVRGILFDFNKDMDFDITFDKINLRFFDKLKTYAFKYRDIKDNYFAKIVAVLKNFMKWAEDREYHYNQAYHKFSYAESETEIIFFTIEELIHLYNFKFEKKKHSNVRDLICFSCFTGLRYSEIKELTHSHIKGNTLFRKVKKTKKIIKIPLNSFAVAILEKHKDRPILALPKYSRQRVNDFIKEACKIAGIDTPVVITESRGGKITEKVLPKYELVGTRIGRKTFVTNSLILGMNVKAIKGVTGHKKDATFEKYLNVVDEYKKEEMNKAWDKVK